MNTFFKKLFIGRKETFHLCLTIKDARWCIGLLSIVCLSYLFTGCIAGNGKITAGSGLAYPLATVKDGNNRALFRLNELDTKARLDPTAISSQLNKSRQQIINQRGALNVRYGEGIATPEGPELPEIDNSTLTSPQFSDVDNALKLLSGLQASPFSLISDTRDIHESLISAELRFKFRELESEGYKFFLVPITISVDPSTRTQSNYIADINFSMEVTKKTIRMISAKASKIDSIKEKNSVSFSAAAKQLFKSKNLTKLTRRSLKIGSIYEDIKILTISPIRQFDRRAETLARRMQLEQAFQMTASGPIGEAITAAVKASVSRLKRMESDYATVTRIPLITGYVQSDYNFGWRVYPSRVLKAGYFETNEKIIPGPHDLMVIIAVKIRDGVKEASSAKLLFEYNARWVRTKYLQYFLPFWPRELKPENSNNSYFISAKRLNSKLGTGTFEVTIPATIKPEALTFDPSSPISPSSGIDLKKPCTLTIEGTGFSINTRVLFNGMSLTPDAFNSTKLILTLPAKSIKVSDKETLFDIVVTNGSNRIAKAGTIKAYRSQDPTPPPAPKASVKLKTTGAINAGELVELVFSDPTNVIKTTDVMFKPGIKISVGGLAVEESKIIILDEAKGLFGFNAPKLPGGVSLKPPIIIEFKQGNISLEYRVDGNLTYNGTSKNTATLILRQ